MMHLLQYIQLLIIVNNVIFTYSLTGHVCTRQKAETYEVTYDRAFICPERYTTACGQLDWRRCTKYRVNTCYMPTQKYAVRYLTVEDCCPGWKNDGGGACTLRVCNADCENEGTCDTDVNGNMKCICLERFYGNRCQNKKQTLPTIILFGTCFMLVMILSTGFLYCARKYTRQRQSHLVVEWRGKNGEECQTLLRADNVNKETTLDDNRKIPSAPLVE